MNELAKMSPLSLWGVVQYGGTIYFLFCQRVPSVKVSIRPVEVFSEKNTLEMRFLKLYLDSSM